MLCLFYFLIKEAKMFDEMMESGTIMYISCPICGQEFELEYIPGMTVNPYCSEECETAGTGAEGWQVYD